ncbi:MAG TPA: DegV family protein [Tissierellia bacterium]|nr:DegV family protein [Tissierellia bacterium]
MIRIVGDSSLDLNEELLQGEVVPKVPFRIDLDGVEWRDTPDVDLEKFRAAMGEARHFKTACGSPQEFYEAFEKEGDVFAITITSKLSGSYNAAVLGKQLYEQAHPDKKIHIVDSLSASTGLALVYIKLKELIDKRFSFEEIRDEAENFVANMRTFFISQSLENLRKAGRLSNIKALMGRLLRVIPIMGATDGVIEPFATARGKQKAFMKLVDLIEEAAENVTEKVLAISHADNLEDALTLKEAIGKRINFKAIHIIPMGALNTLYADNKGIIVSF